MFTVGSRVVRTLIAVRKSILQDDCPSVQGGVLLGLALCVANPIIAVAVFTLYVYHMALEELIRRYELGIRDLRFAILLGEEELGGGYQ